MDEQADPEADGGPDPEPGDQQPDVRRYPSTIGGAFYIAILIAVGIGLGIASFGDWRFGIQIVAGALMFTAVLRLALRQRDAGMLAVRHRLVDAFLLAGSAGLLFFLAATIPNQPG